MPGTVYKWRENTRIAVDAQMAGERVEYLSKKAGGILTPAEVVADARPDGSVLHDAFEWEDGVAAERYREEQARKLIGCLVVSMPPNADHKGDIRAFVNVTRKEEQGYTPISKALADNDLRAQVLAKAYSELEAWTKRYERYQELADLVDTIKMRGVQRQREMVQEAAHH